MTEKRLVFPKKQDALRLAIGVVGIGTSGPLIALSAMPVLTLIFWRNLGGSIASFFMLRKRGELSNRYGFKWSALAGVVLAAHFLGFFISMRLTTVAAGTALTAMQPIFALMLAAASGHRIPIGAWSGMMIAFLGVVIVSGFDLHFSVRAFMGDLSAIIGGALAALYVTLGAKAQREISAIAYTTICYFFCAITALPIALLLHPKIFSYAAKEWLIVLGLVLGAQLLGHSMFNSVLKRVSVAVVSMVVFFEVPMSALLAAWWLHQRPGYGIWLGVVIIVFGSSMVVLTNED